jgi:hypothetical protein
MRSWEACACLILVAVSEISLGWSVPSFGCGVALSVDTLSVLSGVGVWSSRNSMFANSQSLQYS